MIPLISMAANEQVTKPSLCSSFWGDFRKEYNTFNYRKSLSFMYENIRNIHYSLQFTNENFAYWCNHRPFHSGTYRSEIISTVLVSFTYMVHGISNWALISTLNIITANSHVYSLYCVCHINKLKNNKTCSTGYAGFISCE